MNVTELARILKITPQELHEYLPQFGFDIGRKAIKINKSVANKIIREWPNIRRQIERRKEQILKEEALKAKSLHEEVKRIVKIPEYITVRDFATVINHPFNVVLAELLKNGIFASLNEKIDFDTAWLVGSELGVQIELQDKNGDEEIQQEDKLKKALGDEKEEDLRPRPPVIVVMGHVDHGKTKLLDAIRSAHVVEGEAGGITQHIGAYQLKHKNQLITFVDTPGHEAFSAMRSRGAKIADIAILVVAADDGVKPQTVEAFKIIKAAKIPFVVAINKIDKPEANIEKTKQELSSQLGIIPEDWGGKTICAPISAKNGTGIPELLDMVVLTAETEVESLKANPNAVATGTVIESHVDKGAGPVATILIQNGTLHMGDQLLLNDFIIGKIRNLKNYKGEIITEVIPAMPAQVIGLKYSPQVGDIVQVGEGERMKTQKTKNIAQPSFGVAKSGEEDAVKKINIIIKSDVLGSSEAIEESLEKINTKEVKIKIIHKGLGNITDGDIKKAEATGSEIIGFNVKFPPTIEKIAREKNVTIKQYNIIYNLINDFKARIQAETKPVIERIDLGRLKVLAVFKTEKNSQIVGGRVLDGSIEINSLIEVKRDKETIAQGKILKLQSGKQDVTIVDEGQECGIQYEGAPVILEGDILNFYKEKEVTKKI